MDGDVVIEAGDARVTVAVAAGGRLAQIEVRGHPLLVDPQLDPTSTDWGSFPMAPWAGRIRHGRFRFLGTERHLDVNFQDGDGEDPERRHAIHGTVFARAWSVDDVEHDSIELSCPLEGALSWPFAGTARQSMLVTPGALHCELSVHAADEPFPVEIGWHPWFRKPDGVEFEPAAMYRRDAIGLPTGELVAPTDGPWDDCFVNVRPVVLHYDRDDVRAVEITSDCDHTVVYDEPSSATCVEPQSGPPDSVAIRPRILDAARPLRRTMTISW